MAKKITGYIKLQVPAGTANPSPPIGPALGQRGVNIMEFCKAFNAATNELEKGMPIPTIITVYADRSFSFETKTGNFQLAPDSPGFDKGVVIPNFADAFTGSAPDIGAHEAGTPPMTFGVEAEFAPPGAK